MGKIFNILESLNLASKDTKEIFSESTRDIENLQVFKDAISELINAYLQALDRIDATDTLIAIAEK
tara:strand:- start:714 stop:911 length:198 start_codon:yes stop_codon:yes gene_type:complete